MTIGGCGDIEGVMQGDTDEERSDSDYKIGSIIKTNPFAICQLLVLNY